MPPRNSGAQDAASKRLLHSVASAEPHALTPRELEVVRWIAAAKRNSEIALILGCSPRTVQKHIQNILRKLGLETRVAASSWWYERLLKAERSRLPRRK